MFRRFYHRVLAIPNQYWIVLYICIALVSSYFTATSPTGTDFDAYLEAANKFKSRENIYSAPYQNYPRQYFYSVFFAWMISPFTDFPKTCQFLWGIASFGFLYRIYFLIKFHLAIGDLTIQKQKLWILLLFVLSLNTIVLNVSRNQVNLFLLWGILEAFHLNLRHNYAMASFLLAIGVNIKLLPLTVLPYFVSKRPIKFIFFTTFFLLLLYLLPSLVLGWDLNIQWLNIWCNLINPSNHEHVFELDSSGLTSLSSFLAYYFIQTETYHGHLTKLWTLDIVGYKMALNAFRLILVSVGLYLVALDRRESESIRDWRAVFYFCMITPLIFPHQQKYALIEVLPAIAVCLRHFICKYGFYSTLDKIILTLFCLSMFAFSPLNGSDVMTHCLFISLQELKIFTLSVLCLIPIYLYCTSIQRIEGQIN